MTNRENIRAAAVAADRWLTATELYVALPVPRPTRACFASTLRNMVAAAQMRQKDERRGRTRSVYRAGPREVVYTGRRTDGKPRMKGFRELAREREAMERLRRRSV